MNETRLHTTGRSRYLWMLCAALAMTGCGPGASTEDEAAIGQGDDASLYANRSTLWLNAGTGRVDINVCWENPGNAPGSTASARATWRDARRRAVEESWGRMGRVNFYGWDGTDPVNNPTSCTSNAPGLHVVICNLPTDSRCPALPASQSIPGGYPANNGVNNAVRLNPDHYPAIAVHEFGHTLGFYHEEERTDAPNISSGSCAKQSWPNSNPALYGAYDQTGIMSYCQPPTDAPWLSPNDVASYQRFYGRRKANSLVSPRANCAAAHYTAGSGDVFFTWDCDEANRDQELVDVASPVSSTGRNLQMFGTAAGSSPLCMIPETVSSGAVVRLGACASSSGWLFQSTYLRGFGGLCLDLQGGVTAAGTPIQMWTCGALGGANQRWSYVRPGLIKYGTTSWCARLVSGRLALAACNSGDSAQLFTFNDGRLTTSSGKCLDVYGPSDAQFTSGQGMPGVGAFVQEFTCNSALNQRWNVSGPIRHAANSGLCLNRAGADGNGTWMTLATCNGSSNQEWDYYF